MNKLLKISNSHSGRDNICKLIQFSTKTLTTVLKNSTKQNNPYIELISK